MPLKAGHHRPASKTPFKMAFRWHADDEMAFCWRADDGPTLNAGLTQLYFFRRSGPILLRNLVCL